VQILHSRRGWFAVPAAALAVATLAAAPPAGATAVAPPAGDSTRTAYDVMSRPFRSVRFGTSSAASASLTSCRLARQVR